jgi:predicted nucleic acid-binding protein
MDVLADTNVLLRSLYPEHPQCAAAERALGTLRERGVRLCIAPQNLIEFWAVATRPRAQQMDNHESSRTTGLYDRRGDDISLDEVERIGI